MAADEFDDILNIFKVEAGELLKKLGDYTYSLEETPSDKELVALMFQTLHSLKGSARMLGFEGLQNIAHSLEDVLTLVKNGNLEFTSDLFELFYSSYDVLQYGIEKCVEAKSDVQFEQMKTQIERLDRFLEKDITPKKQPDDDIVVSYLRDKSCDITAIVLEILMLFKKCEESKLSSLREAFLILSDMVSQLNSFFVETDFTEIKNILALLVYSANIEETEQTRAKFVKCSEIVEDLRNKINETYKQFAIKPLIEFSNEDKKLKEEIANKERRKEDLGKLGVDTEVAELLASFDVNLAKLQEGKEPANIILEIIHKFLITDISENVSTIMKKMSEILNITLEKNIQIDVNALSIFIYCFTQIKNAFLDACPITQANMEHCLSKLLLLEQLYSLSSNINEDISVAKPLEENSNVTQVPSQNVETVIVPANHKPRPLQDFFKSFEMEEIKTLRVDTQKLDKLVSQTAELIVNGIKTQEHLSVIENINLELTDSLTEAKKMANFLKYFDKRIMLRGNYDEVIVNFYRKIYAYFKQNSFSLNELHNQITYLFKKELEDDTKLNQTISEIENISKNIRVLPLATVFHMFPRMVRDISKFANKEIEFIIQGSDTAVDKKIIEEIKSPLIHILRNAIDHGIEAPGDRELKGKNRVGKILLSAKQEKNEIVITVEDDGVGINLEKIKSKALEKNLLTYEEVESMSDEQLTGLIFWPGFSTGDEITEISGRGIGLDVVQTKLAQLNGKVNVYSVMNKGCKVVIELPITMSTMKVFVISFNNEKYAVPMSAIKLVEWIKPDDIFLKDGRDCIMYQEHSIPIFDMANALNIKSHARTNDNLTVIIVEVENTTVAYIVEKLVGDQEILNKKLSLPIHKLKNIGGVTTLSSGDICLILNINELVRNSLSKINNDYVLTGMNNKLIQEDYKEDYIPASKNVTIFNSSGKMVDYLTKCLSLVGYNNSAFVDYDVIIDYIKRNKTDLLIVDYEKELYQEKDLINKIKTDENLANIPIVVLSSLHSKEVEKDFENIKINAVVDKTDYDEEKFICLLEEILKTA